VASDLALTAVSLWCGFLTENKITDVINVVIATRTAVATPKIHRVISFALGTVKKKDDASKRLCTQITFTHSLMVSVGDLAKRHCNQCILNIDNHNHHHHLNLTEN